MNNVSDSRNRSQKTSHSLEKICIFRMVFTGFPLFMAKSESLPCSVALFLISDRSDLLSLLFTKQQLWVIFSLETGDICFFSRAIRSFARLFTENERFARNIKERIPNPDYYTRTYTHIQLTKYRHSTPYRSTVAHIFIYIIYIILHFVFF